MIETPDKRSKASGRKKATARRDEAEPQRHTGPPYHVRWHQVSAQVFVVLAVGPEAQIDQAGFEKAVVRAMERLGRLDTA